MSNQHSSPPPERGIAIMCLLALVVGVVGGIGAWIFRLLIGLVHNALFLGEAALQYDANLHTAPSPWGLGIILMPVIGGMLVVWLVKNYAPEAKGHGVPEVMDAIHNHDGLIRPRVAVIKSLASAISIGSGGAVGREGPIIQIGSACGSMLGQWVAMPARQRNTLIAAGAGAGIAATFNAPLGGLMFALELLLISVSAMNILLVAIATAVATHIGRLLIGPAPSFDIPSLELPMTPLHPGLELVLLVPFGILMGLLSVLFIRGLYWAEDRFDAMPGNDYSRHALGMFCVGLMMYLMLQGSGHYYIQGVGYATIMDILSGALSDPWFLLLLFALKLTATCLSLGSGGSGGVFSPALFMGATVGAAFAHGLLWLFPDAAISVPAFAIAGMAAGIGGSTGAVLTGIVMLTEMTGDHSIALPLIIVVSSATLVRKRIMNESIYTMKLLRRGSVAPEGLQAAIDASLRVADVMRSDIQVGPGPAAATDTPHWQLSTDEHVITPAPTGEQRLRYLRTSADASLLTSLRQMQASGARVLLVSATDQPDTIIGVVDETALGRYSLCLMDKL